MSSVHCTPVAVVAGGRSPEHEISLRSGREIARVIDPSRWVLHVARLERSSRDWAVRLDAPDPTDPFGPGDWATMSPGEAVEFLHRERGVRLVFPALHGPLGEDGCVQGFLQTLDMPYVGSGVAASAVAMDKLRTRECFSSHDLPMPRAWMGALPRDVHDAASTLDAIERAGVLPGFAKIDLSGSSIGVARVESIDDLRAFFRDSAHLGSRVVVESEVHGEEISVPVLGNSDGEVTALPPVGIYPVADDFFTFDAKYTAGACEEIVPPRGLSSHQIEQVRDLAVRCHRALRCDGLSRTDMIVTCDGPRILETNTMPGFTEASLFPKAAAHVGMSFSELVSELFDLAASRWGVETSAGVTASPNP